MIIKSVKKADVLWSYVGTFISMASSFILLPFLVRYLTGDELGLWYVFVAIANLSVLFEFGFDPTFARNIVYVLSGARNLGEIGDTSKQDSDNVDWHLLNVVIKSSKILFGLIAVAVVALLLIFGSAYVYQISREIYSFSICASWLLFCASIFLNLYFLWSLTVLRGYGDIEAENKARTFSKLLQLMSSAFFLIQGWGLFGASLGYLVNSISIRLLALIYLRRHRQIEDARSSDKKKVAPGEIADVLRAVSNISVRDGIVSFSNYGATQAVSIICSAFLDLTATGIFSISVQIASAIVTFASSYARTFLPMVQHYVVLSDIGSMRKLVSKGVVAYWVIFIFAMFAAVLTCPPLLEMVKPEAVFDRLFFILLCLYYGFWNHHSLCCNYIVCMNEIPYVKSYLVSAVCGILLSVALCAKLGLGIWGLLLGQALAQAAYNNWKWPRYLCAKLKTSYAQLLKQGFMSFTRSERKAI